MMPMRQASVLPLIFLYLLLTTGEYSANAFTNSITNLYQNRNSIVSSSQSAFIPRSNFFTIKRYSTRRTAIRDDSSEDRNDSFNPLNIPSESWNHNERFQIETRKLPAVAGAATAITLASLSFIDHATADSESLISKGAFNPDNFRPVCPASDGFYRFLQGTAQTLVGDDKFVEYGPLIAGGLLRVRLELCVVESFWHEAVIPFVEKNGLSWILPLHETVETFLAGTVFAIATTFILVGSTKIVAVLVTYADVFFGGPCRLLGGFAFDRARGIPVSLDVGIGPWKTRVFGPPKEEEGEDGGKKGVFDGVTPTGIPVVLVSGVVKAAGETSKLLREIVELIDLFVGRYLVILATGYIGFKFIHFKIFTDFPPF